MEERVVDLEGYLNDSEVELKRAIAERDQALRDVSERDTTLREKDQAWERCVKKILKERDQAWAELSVYREKEEKRGIRKAAKKAAKVKEKKAREKRETNQRASRARGNTDVKGSLEKKGSDAPKKRAKA